MTYDEFKRHIGKAGLTIREFAVLIKLKPASISNYAKSGEVPSHLSIIAVLLAELAEHKVDFREILDHVEIAEKKPRGAGKGKFGGDPQALLFPPQTPQTASGAAL
ncbi:hypothetical protein [Geotalea toluenoxydans]|uniref:hypothetical protein n=1 Tax=Geotalea toluenoxydans TaxID=421624 RepID=UPI0006D19609|nr:hypothetical protein [Geotalea toluenoxydans]